MKYQQIMHHSKKMNNLLYFKLNLFLQNLNKLFQFKALRKNWKFQKKNKFSMSFKLKRFPLHRQISRFRRTISLDSLRRQCQCQCQLL